MTQLIVSLRYMQGAGTILHDSWLCWNVMNPVYVLQLILQKKKKNFHGCVYCTGAGTNEKNRHELRKFQREKKKKKLHRAGFEPEHSSIQAELPTHYTNPASPPNTPLFYSLFYTDNNKLLYYGAILA